MMDLVGKVGPGGSFITEEQSSSQCRAEIWAPKVMERSPFATWEQMRRQSLEDCVQGRLLKILREAGVPPRTCRFQENIESSSRKPRQGKPVRRRMRPARFASRPEWASGGDPERVEAKSGRGRGMASRSRDE